jgi:allantoate deiminase
LVAAIRTGIGGQAPTLWSRAGHDAMAMAAVTEVGMLFLRCHDGISHHPAESVREVDVARALDALEATVLHLADLGTARCQRLY